MSDDLLDKKPARTPRWLRASIYIAWGVVSFVAVQCAVVYFLHLFISLGWISVVEFSPVFETMLGVIIYILVVVMAIIIPRLLWREKTSRHDVGLGRLMSWLDIAIIPLAFLAHIIFTGLFVTIAKNSIPGFNVDQVQEVGFENISSAVDRLLAFILLVGIAPFAEELLFRGWLYGKLKASRVLFVVNVLIVSGLFGLAHGQWNVGVDTFALSLVLCSLREWTGSIWAGILLHMTKNAIAYYFTFITPLGGMNN